jgi:glutathione peroxidase
MTSLHDFTLHSLDGHEQPLSAYSGRVALVVNVASQCGLTPQYAGLQVLHESFGGRGLAVLGIPCNQFKGQEPGTADEIRAFCTASYGVTFPMFDKLEVNGPGRHPLYAWLCAQQTEPEGPGDVQWNFGKFLVGKDGAVLARFEPTTDPQAPELVRRIEAAL